MNPAAAGNGPLMISCIAPPEIASALAVAWEDHSGAVSAFEISPGGDWRVEAYGVEPGSVPKIHASIALLASVHGGRLIEPTIGALPQVDWLARNLDSFKPMRVGRFFIRPSHDATRMPPGSFPITLDANIAFGTGEHATTKGCLLAINDMGRRSRPNRVLDMGCGSGILAMAIAKQWRRPVLAVDIDPDSVRITRENAAANQLTPWVRPVVGRSFGSESFPDAAPST